MHCSSRWMHFEEKYKKKVLFLTDDSTEQFLGSQGESQRYSARLAASLARELLRACPAGRTAKRHPQIVNAGGSQNT